VKQMRIDEKFPDGKKDALMKAQGMCRAEEFSDAWLERFLRCEGMDAKVCAGLFFRRTVNHVTVVTLTHSPPHLCFSWELSTSLTIGRVVVKCLGQRSISCECL